MVSRIAKASNIQKIDEILYEEWVQAGSFVKIIILLVCLLIFILGIIISIFMPEELAFLWIISGFVSIFIFLMYWNFRRLKIIITNTQIEVRYGIFNHKRIPLINITNCDITKARFKTYGGLGIRLGLDGSSAYNTDFGEAVKLYFQSGRPFLFSTRNPQRICKLIKEKMN
ncbi:MAG: hypothetical protein JSV62_06245 [Promethearchaeota archaeon]|nr:MAG: hypothetical protein JSV62_06245 [Candidatus Lokiarchaeota archaeon]